MYSIDNLCPTGGMGGYGFCIHLHPNFKRAVAIADVTQEQVNRVLKTYGTEWMQKCGLSGYFDPENCGWDADKHAIPSERTVISLGGTGLRVAWGEWGPEHITVPGNACGLDIDQHGLGNPFPNGRCLLPHNVDHWGQVNALLITFTWFANHVLFSYREIDESTSR